MTFHDLATKASKLVVDNSPLILTAIGVTGTITTAVLTHKAAIKAHSIIEVEKAVGQDPSKKDALKLVWTVYIPPVSTGVMTVGAIVLANRIGTRRAAALAAAYSISERALTEYKDKVIEVVGKNKEQTVRDQVAQDKVTANPVGSTVVVGGGDVLCYEMFTGRYFMSNMEEIKQAMNNVNHRVLNDGYASMSDFYSWLGLNNTTLSDELGWTSDKLMDIAFSTTISEDQKPCLALEYRVTPVRGHYKNY